MSERQFDTMDYDYVETNKVSVSIGEIKENLLYYIISEGLVEYH